jgi:hypothetical protein
LAHAHNNAVAGVDEGFGLDADVGEWLQPLPEELPHPLVTVVETVELERADARIPDDGRVVEREQASMSRRSHASHVRCTTSTFSLDIARSVSRTIPAERRYRERGSGHPNN